MANSLCEVFLTETELEQDNKISDGAAGAVVDFWGVVRGLENGEEIDGIEYEAHPTMAEHQLLLIAQQASARFALERVVIRHRLGFVAVAKASVFVRLASRNRGQAFQAIQWVMDELKQKVPIWKRPKFKMEQVREKKQVELRTHSASRE
jgi:molybdopterin synthase catalytic subunit